jgi:hypothetical protein
MLSTVDVKVKDTVMISSPRFTPKAFKAITNASVPDPTPIACLTPM